MCKDETHDKTLKQLQDPELLVLFEVQVLEKELAEQEKKPSCIKDLEEVLKKTAAFKLSHFKFI